MISLKWFILSFLKSEFLKNFLSIKPVLFSIKFSIISSISSFVIEQSCFISLKIKLVPNGKVLKKTKDEFWDIETVVSSFPKLIEKKFFWFLLTFKWLIFSAKGLLITLSIFKSLLLNISLIAVFASLSSKYSTEMDINKLKKIFGVFTILAGFYIYNSKEKY